MEFFQAGKNSRWILILVLILSAGITRMMTENTSRESAPGQLLRLSFQPGPSSVDPLHYDEFIHHIAFRSVYSSVLTQYRIGKISGVLAESWTASEDFRVWTFRIRDDLKFENGDPITPEIIAHSWTRLGFILRQTKSRSDLFDHLLGASEIQSPRSRIQGIQTSNRELRLRFKTPQPKLLELLSFGLFAVVHPSDFDDNTGRWKDPKKIISSGAYRIEDWSETSLKLRLREDFPAELRHDRAFEQIIMSWNQESAITSDMMFGLSLDSHEGYEFFGGPGSNIAYVHCFSWKTKISPCSNLQSRREARAAFYESLEKTGLKPSMSFFPLAMQGIQEISAPHIKARGNVSGLRFRETKTNSTPFVKFNKSMENAGATPVNLANSDLLKLRDAELELYPVDSALLITGILLEDPRADIRFMFLSKEGIRLPDTDGRIHAELEKEDFSPQKVNELIWDQAVIWPVTHMSLGLWVKKHIDTSLINPLLPPTDIQWLGAK